VNWQEELARLEESSRVLRIEVQQRIHPIPPMVHARLQYKRDEDWIVGAVFHLPAAEWETLSAIWRYFRIEVIDAVPADQSEAKAV